MVAIGSGVSAQIVTKDEVTYGVAPSLASGVDSYEFKSETLAMKKTTVQGTGLHAGGSIYDRSHRRVLTNYSAAGNVVLDLPTRNMGWWLRHMVGSFGQANATPTQIATSGVYKSTHQGLGGAQTTGTLLGHSFTLQKGVPAIDGTVEPFTYVGCKLMDWELKVATGAIADLTLTIDARNELAGAGNGDPLNASVPALAPFALSTAGHGPNLFHFRQATLLTGGVPTMTSGVCSLVGATAAANIKSCDIKHAYKLDTTRYFLGSSGFKGEQIENGFRQITGSFVGEFLSSEALYNAFSADTTTSLQLTFTGQVIGTTGTNTELFDVIIPNIKLDGEPPKVSGPAVVTETIPFTGLDDESTVPIQIVYQSEDATL